MSSISNISVGATYAGNMAHKARHEMNASIMRLSSGSRTVMGGDAAGQSIGNNLMARAKSHYVAARNAEDGISALLTSESALNEIANIAYRIRELGVQADNAALLSSSMEVAAMNQEVAALYDTINNIHDEVKFNEKALNEIANIAYRIRELGIQADNAALLSSSMEIAAMNAEVAALYDTINNIHDEVKFNEKALNGEADKTFAIGSSIDGTNNNTIQTNDTMETGIETYTTAADAEASADKILTDVALGLGHVAAGISSLKARQAVSYASAANLEAAASRILDTDYARETANLTKNSVLNQSAMAMVAQANQAQSAILAVLQ